MCAPLALLCVLASCGDEDGFGADLPDVSAQLVPQAPRIGSVRMSGPGCDDAGPHAIGITGDRDTFRIDFERLAVSASGPMSRETECNVSVVLDAPIGTKYAPAGLNLTGHGAQGGIVSTEVSWTSTPEQVLKDSAPTPSGAFLTRALDSRRLGEASLWSECTGTRELRFKVRLALGDDRGSAQIERLEDLRFYARDCPRYLDK